jgi:hypothetical protein
MAARVQDILNQDPRMMFLERVIYIYV